MKPELLSPAGDIVSLKAAIDASCDAVFFGIKEFNMRITSNNFSLSDLPKIVKLCKQNSVKAYLTLNTIIYEKEVSKVVRILTKAKKAGIDAIICWDLSVIKIANKLKIPIHLSTQASVSNFSALEYYNSKFKIKRVTLARECSLSDIKKIITKIKKNKLKIEVETFVHGAMCVGVSGRCFTSQFLYGKSANRGDCIQPCRRKYNVFDIEEHKALTVTDNYVMSPKDLCTIGFLDKLIKAGINSFKIEGRARSPEYVKVVTECYREAIDYGQKLSPKLKEKLEKKLKTVYNRSFSSGFYMGKPIKEWSGVYGSVATKKKMYLGSVLNYYNKVSVVEVKLESLGVKIGDVLMIQGPTTGVIEQKIESINLAKKSVKSALKGDIVGVQILKKARKNDKAYIIRERQKKL